MSISKGNVVGQVVLLRRYPVKSMQGEELNAVAVTPRGLLGDRALALVDVASGMIVSAKNPRKWPAMFDFRGEFVEPPSAGKPLPIVRITLPDGSVVTSNQPDAERVLSDKLGRPVRLSAAAPEKPHLEEYWPDIEELSQRDKVTDETILEGTFFDGAPLHVLTTATLDRLRETYPQGRFEARRFRANLVIEPTAGAPAFLEDTWVDRYLQLGSEVRLRIVRRCPRCVMTTLPQADLPGDSGILRTAARNNAGHVGVYATVERPGLLRRGDAASIAE